MVERRRGRSAARLGIALGLLAALIALFWSVRGQPEGGAAGRRPVAEPRGSASRSPRPALTADDGEGAAIVIDEIRVEKPALCASEENLISVRAHTTRPEDAPELQIHIDGKAGARVALRPTQYLRPDGTPPQVIAFLSDGRRVSADIPRFEVRDCAPDRILHVRHRSMPNAPDHVEFWARVFETGPGPEVEGEARSAQFRPVRYRWDFGDGTSAVTETPIVDKSFRDRRQDTLVTQVLVTCVAEAADGDTLVGRDNLSMLNHAYENLARKGVVVLEVDQPRFPEADDQGVVVSPMRIWHHHTTPVTVTELRVLRVEREGVAGAGGGREHEERVPGESVLGTTRIPASGIRVTVSLDTRADPELSYVLYRVSGRTDDGLRAAGEFSVMRPTDLPTPERHIVVTDAQLMIKIMAAQRILGRQYVTDEDIWRLEREGRLDDLAIDPATLPAHMPEPPVGPKGLGNAAGADR